MSSLSSICKQSVFVRDDCLKDVLGSFINKSFNLENSSKALKHRKTFLLKKIAGVFIVIFFNFKCVVCPVIASMSFA